MVNSKALLETIEKSGFKKQYIADALGMRGVTLWRKINNVSEFKPSEIVKLCEILDIHESKVKDRLFFAKTVYSK